MLTIKKILIAGFLILILIWGLILFLAFSDHSYQLFVPKFIKTTSLNLGDKSSGVDLSQTGPWKQDLFMATGNGSSFDGKSFLAHGVATPSAIVRNNEVLVYFNYFPQNTRKGFSTIHLIKSTTNGRQWTQPLQVVINQSAGFTTVPASPKAIVTTNGKIKLYFLAKKPGDDRTKMFAAVSDDGQNFVFDPKTQFEIENESLISIAVNILDDRLHLMAYTQEGSLRSTAYHAISYDTNVFTRLADVTIKDSYYGQNTLLNDGNSLKLIGNSLKGLWSSTSKDGNTWSNPSYLSFNAQNPGITKL